MAIMFICVLSLQTDHGLELYAVIESQKYESFNSILINLL